MNELVAPMFYVLCNSRSEGDNEALPAAESDGGATARVDAEAGGEDRDGGGDGDAGTGAAPAAAAAAAAESDGDVTPRAGARADCDGDRAAGAAAAAAATAAAAAAAAAGGETATRPPVMAIPTPHECDTFWCFSQLMEPVQHWFTRVRPRPPLCASSAWSHWVRTR